MLGVLALPLIPWQKADAQRRKKERARNPKGGMSDHNGV